MAFSAKFREMIYSLFAGKEEIGKEASFSALAYMGDSLFDLYIRLYILESYPGVAVDRLHRLSAQYSNSHSQRLALEKIHSDLRPEEKRLVERAKQELKKVPSHIHLLDYHSSSALESLLGYLFLKKDFQRLLVLFDRIIQETRIYEKEL